MACKIQNNSQLDIDEYIHSLVDFAKDRMGFQRYPEIVLADDEKNSSNVLGRTAFYDPSKVMVQIYVSGRHAKDVLRSIAHELVHHTQHENGEFEGEFYTGPGYAQKDPKMREMERQAYEQGNLCLRDWEDGIKAKNETIYKKRSINTMSLNEWKNKELNRLLMKKFGLLNESNTQEQEEETVEEMNTNEGNCGCPDLEGGEGEVAIVQLAEEDKKPDEDGDGVPDWADKKQGEDDHADEEKEEKNESVNIREALKIAMGILESRLEK